MSENIFGARMVASLGLLLCALILAQRIASQEQESPRSTNAGQRLNTSTVEGKQAFESRCAGCHGLDGRGGERAPDIASNAKTQQRSDGELSRIVERGLPGTGMPAFASLGSNVNNVVAYLRELQGRKESARLPAVRAWRNANRHAGGNCYIYGEGAIFKMSIQSPARAASSPRNSPGLLGIALRTKFAKRSSGRPVRTD